MEARRLIICRGIQGSGKTTFAKKFIHDNGSDKWVRINNDDIRNMLGDYWIPDRESFVAYIYNKTIQRALCLGYNIIIDNMNLNPKTIGNIEKTILDYNENFVKYHYDIEFKDFFIPLEECIANDLKRGGTIGAKVIKKTWRRYAHIIVPAIIKAKPVKEKDSNLPNAIIVDIDGTLASNITGRPFFGLEDESKLLDDAPIMDTINLVKKYMDTHYIFFISGRDGTEEGKKYTEEWLKEYDIWPYDDQPGATLILRRPGNYMPAEEFKKRVYMDNILDSYNVDLVLEDTPKVINMFRELGLTVLDCGQ